MNKIVLMLMLLIKVVCVPVYAACTEGKGGTQTVTINLGEMDAKRNAAVGSVIASGTFGSRIDDAVDCDGGSYYLSYEMTYEIGQYISDYTYKTNVPGVGIRVTNTKDSFPLTNPTTLLPYGGGSAASSSYYVEFIKTGNITSGKLDTGRVGRYFIQTQQYVYQITIDNIEIGPGNVIDQISCDISTPNMTFPLGTIQAAAFGSSVGTIPEGAQNTQNLGLNCDAGANINVTLNGTQNPDVSTTSVLALTGQGKAGVASGVGVQLLYNGAPLELNKIITLKKSAGGQETLPLTARYYQTKTTVFPGEANTSATLGITYQ